MKYAKDFFRVADVAIMTVLFLTMAVLAVPGLFTGLQWAMVLLGMGLYLVSEYTTHRFLFHMKRPTQPWLLRMIERLHYLHHETPNDLDLLFLPLWYSLPQMALIGGLTWYLTGSLAMAAALLTGIMGTLLWYEWTHFVAHRPITPLTPWGRLMKKHHLWHHFKNEHYWYGVTNPTLDLVFGTYKDESEVERSTTVRHLE